MSIMMTMIVMMVAYRQLQLPQPASFAIAPSLPPA